MGSYGISVTGDRGLTRHLHLRKYWEIKKSVVLCMMKCFELDDKLIFHFSLNDLMFIPL